MTIYLSVYVTYPDRETADAISRALLENHLVACANTLPGGQSRYWWEGKLASAEEVYVFYKTTRDKFEALEKRIVEMHPYDVPCIVATNIETGHMPFLRWITTETR